MYIHGTGKLHEKHRFNSFADIIENRDDSTGNHVKRTTAYVGIILKGMKRHNYYRVIVKFSRRGSPTRTSHCVPASWRLQMSSMQAQ